MITQTEQITELAIDLLKAQKEIGSAKKDALNPFFKKSYADLLSVINTVKEPLNANGITFLQAVNVGENGTSVVDTMLLHESGQYLVSSTPVICAKQGDPQAFGIGVTYAKRYGLQSLLGVPSDDDDGEGLMDRKKTPAAQPTPKPTPKPTPPAKTVTEQAYQKFIDHHQAKLKEFKGFDFDYETFKASVIDLYGKEPTQAKTIDIIIHGSEVLDKPALRIDKALKKVEVK